MQRAIQRRKNRIQLLEGFEKRLEDYATDLSTLAGQLAKDYSHLAVMYGKLNRKAEVHDSMNRALSWAAKSGELSDPNYYRTVLNIYAWAISSRALFEGYDFETLDEKSREIIAQLGGRSKVDISDGFRMIQLELFQATLQLHNSNNTSAIQAKVAQIMQNPIVREIKTSLPEKYAMLRQYEKNLTRKSF